MAKGGIKHNRMPYVLALNAGFDTRTRSPAGKLPAQVFVALTLNGDY